MHRVGMLPVDVMDPVNLAAQATKRDPRSKGVGPIRHRPLV
jgi:hypothetical protein